MATGRYTRDARINLGQQLGTPESMLLLKNAFRTGMIPITKTIIATGDDRLDTLSGALYGDAKYWWVLAVASGIGWGLQIPPGTVVKVPSLSDVLKVVS